MKKTKTYFLFTSFLLIFAWRYHSSVPKFRNGDALVVQGKVLAEPYRTSRSQIFEVAGITIFLLPQPEVLYGDAVIVRGTYLDGNLTDTKLVTLKRGNQVFRVREKILNFYKHSLPYPHWALVAGVTLGVREGVRDGFREQLINSGVLHVVVASGTNVTLVGGFVMSTLLPFLRRRKALAVTLVMIWFYVVLSGFEAPLIRAAIMGTVAFGAQASGRLSSAFRALFASAILMLLAKPLWIRDVGFLLSFAATTSLILFETKIYNKLGFIKPDFVRRDLATTLSAQIGVTPILYVAFQRVNFLAPIPNALALWTVVPVMIIGGLAGVVGIIFPFIGRMLLWSVYPLTSYFLFIVNMFS